MTEIGFHNNYSKRAHFIDLEKHLIKNNFELYAINVIGGFSSKFKTGFGCDLIYVNKSL